MRQGVGTDRRRNHTTLIRRVLRGGPHQSVRVIANPRAINETFLADYEDSEALMVTLRTIPGVASVSEEETTSLRLMRVLWEK